MPELTPFQEWSPSSGPIADPIENRKQYSNYVREEYIKSGEYNEEVGEDILGAAARALVEVDGVSPKT